MMLFHPSHRTLLALDRGEVSDRRHHRLQEHVAVCPRCRGALDRIRAVRAAAAEVTAPPVPDVLDRVQGRIAAGERVLLPVPENPRARTASVARDGGAAPPRLRLVAGGRRSAAALAFLLVGAGGVAGAVAVEPVRAWLWDAVTAFIAPDPTPGAPAPIEPVAGLDVPVPSSGLTVELVAAGPDLGLRLEAVAGATEGLAAIVGTGVAAGARFRSGEARVEVEGARSGTLRVTAPARAARIRLVADGRILAEIRGGQVLPRGGTPTTILDTTLGALLAGADEALPDDEVSSGTAVPSSGGTP